MAMPSSVLKLIKKYKSYACIVLRTSWVCVSISDLISPKRIWGLMKQPNLFDVEESSLV